MAVNGAAGVPALAFAMGPSAAAALCGSAAAFGQGGAQPNVSAAEKDAERTVYGADSRRR
jgi:hypothetical protein